MQVYGGEWYECVSLFYDNIISTLLWKNYSDKPQVWAEPSEPKALLRFDTIPFSHGFCAFNNDFVGIMGNAITNCIRNKRIKEFIMPAGNVKLGAENRR